MWLQSIGGWRGLRTALLSGLFLGAGAGVWAEVSGWEYATGVRGLLIMWAIARTMRIIENWRKEETEQRSHNAVTHGYGVLFESLQALKKVPAVATVPNLSAVAREKALTGYFAVLDSPRIAEAPGTTAPKSVFLPPEYPHSGCTRAGCARQILAC